MCEEFEREFYKCLTLNYLYELQAYCTSIVMKLTDGQVILGRNLDFDFASDLRKQTFEAHWYKGDKFVFESIMFAGTVGIYTG